MPRVSRWPILMLLSLVMQSAVVMVTSCAETRLVRCPASGRDWARVICVNLREGVYFDLESGSLFQHSGFILEPWSKFSEDLCAVKKPEDGKEGYINRAGCVIIPFQYDAAGEFGDARALVQVGKAEGIIDMRGRWVLAPGRYDALCGYSEGRCAFRRGERWGFLNTDGNVVIPAIYREASFGVGFVFSEGLCQVKNEAGDRVYIDREGTVRIKLHAEWDGDAFYGGLARVSKFISAISASAGGPLDCYTLPYGYVYGYISKDGRVAIEPRFGTAGRFSEGLAAVTMTHDGLLSENGEIIDEWSPDPEIAEPPPAWGFINPKGEVVIPMVYEKAKHFCEGLAPVMQGGKWGYIDHTGRKVIGAGFEDAEMFRNGVAQVVIGEKIAYIDKTGRILVRTGVSGLKF